MSAPQRFFEPTPVLPAGKTLSRCVPPLLRRAGFGTLRHSVKTKALAPKSRGADASGARPASAHCVIVDAAAAHARLAEASRWLAERGPAARVLVVGGTVDAAHEVCRAALAGIGAGRASFGWERTTLGRAAATWAAPGLTRRGLVPMGQLPLAAVAARVVHQEHAKGGLGRFARMVERPGFARALARSFEELRMAGIRGGDLGDRDLDALLSAFEEELARGKLADRAVVFAEAAAAVRAGAVVSESVAFVDVPVASALDAALVGSLASVVARAFVAVPRGDARSLAHFRDAFPSADVRALAGEGALSPLQDGLFAGEAIKERATDAAVLEIFSAPGESRECVEMVRRVCREAAQGTPFDRMAVVLRAPTAYRAHLLEAFRRASVPCFFSRGSRRPDPAGRAFLALLGCAADGLSARRFAEYLSLGEVPDAAEDGEPPPARPRAETYVAPDEELAPRFAAEVVDLDDEEEERSPTEGSVARDGPVIGGWLRTPYRWEHLLVEAADIGGLDRWRRRLDGYARELASERASLTDPDGPRAAQLDRMTADIRALRAYGLPLLAELAELPVEATWGEWIERLSALASRALRRPTRVLSLLAELDPMGDVGPVRLDEVRLALEPRLTELPVKPDARRYGKVFVGSPEEVRGLSFDVVFVPALAERLFPQKISEDPILLDEKRVRLARGLTTNHERTESERLALHVAVGAARRRVVLSYPRVDIEQGRPRTPSFYALELLRAVEGRLPSFSELARRAEQVGGARIGWPAPRTPDDAIDEAEHDLALLEGIFQRPEAETVGMARFLLAANPHLGRALRFRGQRWVRKWSGADGLVEPRPGAREALAAHSMDVRSFSPTALQNFAACPYRFVLQALHRLAPRKEPAPIEELDPLQRGSLLHEIEFELHVELRSAGLLPIAPERLEEADLRLRKVVERVAARFEEELAPAIDRVYRDAVDSLTADVREMLRREAHDPRWRPTHFELAFGLTDRSARDAASVTEPVDLPIGLKVRGSIDLVEESAEGTLRATDYKTGKVRAKEGETIIGGGQTLQPVLYALALEQMFQNRIVEGGRLYYCTAAAGFHPVWVALDDDAREGAKAVVSTIRAAMTEGFLPAAPKKGECEYCDYKSVCGPYEELRANRVKFQDKLKPLHELRKRA